MFSPSERSFEARELAGAVGCWERLTGVERNDQLPLWIGLDPRMGDNESVFQDVEDTLHAIEV